jgi:hypothetical protein
MSNNISTEGASEAARLEALTGMGVPESELQEEQAAEPSPKVEEKPKVEAKTEEAKADTEGESEDEDEENKNEKEPVRSVRSPKESRPIKAIFSQLGEINKAIADLKKASVPEKQEAKEAVDEALSAIAERRGLDSEGLAEIAGALEKKIIDSLEKSGKFKNDLPEDVKEKMKALDQLQEKMRIEEEATHFDKEWNSILPTLQKQYPNASASELAEAKKVMDELSHSKDFHKYELDYVLFKNGSKFDALLKVVKGKKSAEGESKQIKESSDDEEDIDLDPENMTPEKMKAYNKRKYAGQSDKIEIMG